MQKTITFSGEFSIFTAERSIVPSNDLLFIVDNYFPQINLNQIFISISILKRKIKKENLESNLKKELKDISRYSYKLVKRKINKHFKINGFDLLENHQIDLTELKAVSKAKQKIVFSNLIKKFKLFSKKGRPEDVILLHSIKEIDDCLQFYCNTTLKNHISDSGFASSPETRFHGVGIQLTEKILKQAEIDFYSRRSLFDAIKKL